MSDNVTLAVAYYLNGTGFRMSAQKLSMDLELDEQGRPTKLTAIPLFFLASHAAELFLKAALLKLGTSDIDLKKFDYRHNLSSLLEMLLSKGVSVSSTTATTIKGLSVQHTDHALRYTILVDNGKTTFWPPLTLVFSALDELLLLTRVGDTDAAN